MAEINTPEVRKEVLDRIKKDGVRLKEFNENQQNRIIKTYAAIVLGEKKTNTSFQNGVTRAEQEISNKIANSNDPWEQFAQKAITDSITSIKFYIKEGWDKEKAIAKVKSNSTLGPKPWQKVIEAIK